VDRQRPIEAEASRQAGLGRMICLGAEPDSRLGWVCERKPVGLRTIQQASKALELKKENSYFYCSDLG